MNQQAVELLSRHSGVDAGDWAEEISGTVTFAVPARRRPTAEFNGDTPVAGSTQNRLACDHRDVGTKQGVSAVCYHGL
jgi:hypothetical protein